MVKDKKQRCGIGKSGLTTVLVLSLLVVGQRSEAFELSELFETARTGKGKLERHRKNFKRMREGTMKGWRYGWYVDVGYLPNLSSPDADEWRSKTTDFKLKSPKVNLARGYIRKEGNPIGSRWGGEFALQTGVDSEGPVSKTSPDTIDEADTLRHSSPGNLSNLLPAGNGLNPESPFEFRRIRTGRTYLSHQCL